MDKKYEDLSLEIDELLLKYKAKWQLKSLSWLDYDDVCQIIRSHIYKKWHLWDQTRPFKPWASMLISNQIKNLIRNNYSNYAKPCLKCPYFLSNEECAFTESGKQDSSCDTYAKWQKKKEKAYNIKIPISLDCVLYQNETDTDPEFNYEQKIDTIHRLTMDCLSDKHKEIYHMLYIQHIDEHAIAKKFGFKKDSSKRKTPRYKQINNLKKKFFSIAEKIIKDNDLL